MTIPTSLTITRPLHDGFDIQYHDIGPRQASPRLALVAGLDRHELNGMFILSRLAGFLKAIDAGESPGRHLRARVVVIPMVRSPGGDVLERPAPVGAAMHNGVPAGRHYDGNAQCLVAAVLDATRQAYYRIDVGSYSLDIEEMPQVRLCEPNDDERATACLFGLPAVIERPTNNAFIHALLSEWHSCGGENFVIQAGQAGNLQPAHCEILFRALIAFLDRTGIVEGFTLSEEEEDLHYFGLHQTFTLNADQSGIFVSRLQVGRWIHAGEVIGHIYDGFTGDVRAEIAAPVSGLLGSLRRQPLLVQGEIIARILMAKPPRDKRYAPPA